MHIYHAQSGAPLVSILRPGRTPKGSEVLTVIKHVTRRLRKHWGKARILWRGDGHSGRVECMELEENNGENYIFDLAGNPVLNALTASAASNLRFHHAASRVPK